MGPETAPVRPPISRVIYFLFWTKLTQLLTWTTSWIIALLAVVEAKLGKVIRLV